MTHLPTTIKEVRARGWEELDVIIFTGDAYVDHPSFGAAVIGRVLERAGYRVAIVPQPNWQDDLRDFTKLGAPRLFFGVTAGAMDSMVNHYTANKRLRSDDAYTAGGTAGRRPDRAVTVYSRILKKLYPHIPVVAAGIEASLRRLTHYDYWDDKLHPSILVDSGADVVAYGMGERVVLDIAKALHGGFNMHLLRKIPQIAYLVNKAPLSPTYNNHHSEPPQAACSLPLYSREVASGECVMEHRGMKRLPPGMAASRCDFDEQSRPNRSKILLAPPPVIPKRALSGYSSFRACVSRRGISCHEANSSPLLRGLHCRPREIW